MVKTNWIVAGLVVFLAFRPHATGQVASHPGCVHDSAEQCAERALGAMGGRERWQQIKSLRLQNIGHTLLMEQSYRQAPFIAAYSREARRCRDSFRGRCGGFPAFHKIRARLPHLHLPGIFAVLPWAT